MKLRELKCVNCGASLDVPEGAKKVTCQFCNTSFKVEDAYSDAYDSTKGVLDAQMDVFNEMRNQMFGKHFGRGMFVVPFVIFFTVAAIMIGSFIIIGKNADKDFDITRFNNSFTLHEGTNMGVSVKNVLEDIVTVNKTNKDHKITVVYEDINTLDTSEITSIKKNFEDFKEYELSFEYDEDGYIYKLVITK